MNMTALCALDGPGMSFSAANHSRSAASKTIMAVRCLAAKRLRMVISNLPNAPNQPPPSVVGCIGLILIQASFLRTQRDRMVARQNNCPTTGGAREETG